MRTNLILILFTLTLSINTFAQGEKYIYTASSLNYYPQFESYSFFKTLQLDQDNLYLNFLTSNSGTFVVEEILPRDVENELRSKFPTQILNVGASFQSRNRNGTFQEISLSRLSSFKSSYINGYKLVDSLGNKKEYFIGYNQKSFIMSLRYEYGKMFGNKRNPVRFGVSGIIEPTYYSYKREEQSTRDFSIDATILSLTVAVAPTLSFKLSKKVELDFKLIPRFLLADFGSARRQDPTLTLEQQKGSREYNLPEIDLASTIQLRYMLKEPRKKRGRSNG